MHLKIRFVFTALILLAAFSCGSAAFAADDLNSVLSKLDDASAKFHTTTADLDWESTQTDPVPDTDVQKGTVYYQRSGAAFQMGVHVDTDNGQPAPKVIVCCAKGAIQLYEKLQNQVTTLSKLSQYESWFKLGFGASGEELKEKWDGRRLRADEARKITGIETIVWQDAIGSFLQQWIHMADSIYLNSNEHDRRSGPLLTREHRFIGELQGNYPLHTYRRSAKILRELRTIKTAAEIELMQKAADITGETFHELLRFIKPGVMEYAV